MSPTFDTNAALRERLGNCMSAFPFEEYPALWVTLRDAQDMLKEQPVLGECEDCGHTLVSPLKRL